MLALSWTIVDVWVVLWVAQAVPSIPFEGPRAAGLLACTALLVLGGLAWLIAHLWGVTGPGGAERFTIAPKRRWLRVGEVH